MLFADLAARVLDLLQISIVMLDDVIHIFPNGGSAGKSFEVTAQIKADAQDLRIGRRVVQFLNYGVGTTRQIF